MCDIFKNIKHFLTNIPRAKHDLKVSIVCIFLSEIDYANQFSFIGIALTNVLVL